MDDIFSLDMLYSTEGVSDELHTLVRHGLHSQLEKRLDELPNATDYLTELNSYSQGKLTLLMAAALHGYEEIVRFLITHRDPTPQMELKGELCLAEGLCIHGATALYCACYHEHFTVAKILLELGQANVNQDTYDNPNYPLLLNATIMNRLDIVRFLIENGYSDVNETQSDGVVHETALIWAARLGHVSLVQYLIENGADVNYSCGGDGLMTQTPLFWAVQAGHVKSVALLYQAGADINAQNVFRETPLITAIKHKYYPIINFLLERAINTPDDLELIASSSIESSSDIAQARHVLELCKLVQHARELLHIPKVSMPSLDIYEYRKECQTIDELNGIQDDQHQIWIETLLIRERIALSRPDMTLLEPLLDYGYGLASNEQWSKSLLVYSHLLHRYQPIQLNGVLDHFIWLFCKLLTGHQRIPVDMFIQVCCLAFETSIRENLVFDMNHALCLVIMTVEVLKQEGITKEEKVSIYCWVKDLCRRRLTTVDGQTLLHLCVDQETNASVHFRSEDTRPHLKFPNEAGLQLLLSYGSTWLDLDAIEPSNGNTPLHIICRRTEDQKIVELLLSYGCHVHCVNRHGVRPVDYARNEVIRRLLNPKPIPLPLKCICAHTVANHRLSTDTRIASSSNLAKLILSHGGSLHLT